MENQRALRPVWLSVIIALLVLSVPELVWAMPPGQGFHCVLTGGSPQPLAEVSFRLSEDGTQLHYTLKVHNIENITMAHLHLGKVGHIGTPVAWLYPSSPPPKLIAGKFDGVLAQGTITAKDLIGGLRGRPLADLIDEMRAGNIHVNVHTREHPEGSICGQVYLEEE
jgi:hypothetical protein